MNDATDDLNHPAYVATIAGKPVRFFAAPHDALPWVAIGDVLEAADISTRLRESLMESVRTAHHSPWITPAEAEWCKPKSVLTENGEEVVSHQVAACALIKSLIEESGKSVSFADSYRDAVGTALKAVHGGAPDPRYIERLQTVCLVMYRFDEQKPS